MFSQFRLGTREASVWESVYGVLYSAPFSLEGPSRETQWQGQPGEVPESQEPSKPGHSKEANQDSPSPRSELFLLQAAPSRSILLLLVIVGIYWTSCTYHLLQAVGFSLDSSI